MLNILVAVNIITQFCFFLLGFVPQVAFSPVVIRWPKNMEHLLWGVPDESNSYKKEDGELHCPSLPSQHLLPHDCIFGLYTLYSVKIKEVSLRENMITLSSWGELESCDQLSFSKVSFDLWMSSLLPLPFPDQCLLNGNKGQSLARNNNGCVKIAQRQKSSPFTSRGLSSRKP
jgi:hypothetical protein